MPEQAPPEKKKSGFASKTLAEHLLRGLIGGAALWYAIWISGTCYLCAAGGLVVMFLAFRGCPTCWTVGLFETSCRLPGKKAEKKDASAPKA